MKLLLKNLTFTVVVPGSVAGYVPLTISRGVSPAPGLLFVGGVALLAIGAAVYCWCVWDFATRGGGTPAPIDAPKTLVVQGPYQYSRNPMYVGVLTASFGWALVFESGSLVLYAAAIAIGFHLFVVLYEEPRLSAEFPDDYDAYTAKTNRWVPKFPSTTAA